MISPSIISGAFLGWTLGANDAANIFGTAVYTKVVKYRVAVMLTGIFVILGAYFEGAKGVNKLSDFAYNGGVDTSTIAFIVMLAAALTVFSMTMLKFPVSTSQAVIGSIMGAGLLSGQTDFSKSAKFFSAWFLTPVGGLVISFVIYKLYILLIEKRIKNIVFYDNFIKAGFYISGMFSAYSLGANNVANVTSVYSGQLNLISTKLAVLIGGISIALGVVTFSRRVMETVGTGLVKLSPVSGFISVLASGITVYIYAQIGIPVSSSQAIVGAIIGIGLVKGVNTVKLKTIKGIFIAWFSTPTIAALLSCSLVGIYNFFS